MFKKTIRAVKKYLFASSKMRKQKRNRAASSKEKKKKFSAPNIVSNLDISPGSKLPTQVHR